MSRQLNGVVNLDVRDSVEDWGPYLASRAGPYLASRAPADAPNVLVILYDDTGMAAWSPYGGRIQMPAMQRLADNGLTYSQWHTTALCGEGLCIGRDSGDAVSEEYEEQFPFTGGTIRRLRSTWAMTSTSTWSARRPPCWPGSEPG